MILARIGIDTRNQIFDEQLDNTVCHNLNNQLLNNS